MFSFFLHSKLVITNLLQFIKFFPGRNPFFRRRKQEAVAGSRQTILCAQRTRRAYPHTGRSYIPDHATGGVPTNGMASPTAVCKTGVIKVSPFAFNFMCLLFKHTDRPFYAPLPPMCKGTQIKRETANFSAVSFLLIGMRVQTDWRTHRPRFHKNQSNTRMNPSAHNPPDTLPPGADFAPFSAAQFCFAELQTP